MALKEFYLASGRKIIYKWTFRVFHSCRAVSRNSAAIWYPNSFEKIDLERFSGNRNEVNIDKLLLLSTEHILKETRCELQNIVERAFWWDRYWMSKKCLWWMYLVSEVADAGRSKVLKKSGGGEEQSSAWSI